MSVWLEQARSYPSGVVATPHYLATSAGLAMLASGGNAIDAALAANLVLGVVTPYMCGVGGDLLAIVWDGDVQAYRGVGRTPSGATLDAVRDAVGVGDDADVRPAPVHGARRGRRLVHAARAVGDPLVRRGRARRRAGTPTTDSRSPGAARSSSRTTPRCSSTSGCTTSPTRTARPPRDRGCASPRSARTLQHARRRRARTRTTAGRSAPRSPSGSSAPAAS